MEKNFIKHLNFFMGHSVHNLHFSFANVPSEIMNAVVAVSKNVITRKFSRDVIAMTITS